MKKKWELKKIPSLLIAKLERTCYDHGIVHYKHHHSLQVDNTISSITL